MSAQTAKEQALCVAHATASTALADLLRAALERGKEIGAAEEREACARLVEQTVVMHFLPAETRAELAAIVRSGEPL